MIPTFRARAGDRFLAASEANAHFGPYANTLVADAIVEFLFIADWVDLASPRRDSNDTWAAERALRDRAATRWVDYRESADLQIERSFQEGGVWRDSARVNLSQSQRPLVLFARWPDGATVDRAVLGRLLRTIRMLASTEES